MTHPVTDSDPAQDDTVRTAKDQLSLIAAQLNSAVRPRSPLCLIAYWSGGHL